MKKEFHFTVQDRAFGQDILPDIIIKRLFRIKLIKIMRDPSKNRICNNLIDR